MAKLKVYPAELDGVRIRPNRNETDTGDVTTWGTGVEHHFQNDGHVVLEITKGGTASALVVHSTFTLSGLELEDRSIAIPASQTTIVGPFPPNISNEATGSNAGYTKISFTGNWGGLQVIAHRLP